MAQSQRTFFLLFIIHFAGLLLVCNGLVAKEEFIQTFARDKREVTTNDRDSCKSGKPNPPSRTDTTFQLGELRRLLRRRGLAAYIVPTNDAHLSEYVSEHDKRRVFISGFTGSAATAVITQTKAALFTDGRYFTQADEELDCRNWLLMKEGIEGYPATPQEWLTDPEENAGLQSGDKVGVDPSLVSHVNFRMVYNVLQSAGMDLVAVDENLVDIIWANRPDPPKGNIMVQPTMYAGKTWMDKVKELREDLAEHGNDVMVVVSPLAETAWLFNLRGSDIAYNPFFFAYTIVTPNEILLYVDNDKVTDEVRRHVQSNGCNSENCVKLRPYEDIFSDITRLSNQHTLVSISNYTSQAILSRIPEGQRLIMMSPLEMKKAQKNDVEIENYKKCQIRDSAILCIFLSFLEKEIEQGNVWSELSASNKLEEMRRNDPLNRGLSFATIAGSGPNGAIIHYRSQGSTNRNLTRNEMFLLDSGGQYLDGTTDVTRTMHYGTPKDLEKEAYTRVLQGSIDYITAFFPQKPYRPRACGIFEMIDVIPRQHLWLYGMQYRHGTSHGIGSYMSVHESKGPTSLPMLPRIFMSNEPGYYKVGDFGVRLETIQMTKIADTPMKSDDLTFITFEPLTFVPFEPKLIKIENLSMKQRKWLNNYHRKCRELTGAELKRRGETEAYDWLMQKSQPICEIPGCEKDPKWRESYYSCSNCLIASSFLIVLSVIIKVL